MNPKTASHSVVAQIMCLAIGFVGYNLPGHVLWINIPIIFVTVFIFSLISPRQTWRWGLIFGLGIPIVHMAMNIFRDLPVISSDPNSLFIYTALIPAFAGAYMGMFFRKQSS